jgi:hypothetical protein
MSVGTVWASRQGLGSAAGGRRPQIFTSAGGSPTSSAPFRTASKQLPLFAPVRLVQSLAAEDERLPPGSIGTIVEILGWGRAYVVEFFHPRYAVVTVHDGALVRHNA